jgi:glycosyltransferase involved in cell wall biosynthesis
MKLLFNKGPIFYAEFNLRLFFKLLLTKVDVLHANDLDTLLPNFLVSKIKGIPLIYDAHEYFTEVPELEGRTIVKKIWKSLEAWIFPKLKYALTVNDSIASLYEAEYGVKPEVLRNIPELVKTSTLKSKRELGIPENRKIIVLQGAGINIQRGAEEAVEAMQFLENAVLLIIGGGDVIENLKTLVKTRRLSDKVVFLPKMPFNELMQFTRNADVGLTLDKDTNINYRFSLPNKLFDYIHCGIPTLASNLPEVRKIIEEYSVGIITPNHQPVCIAQKIEEILNSPIPWKQNCESASLVLNWENEKKALIKIYQSL